MRGPSRRFNAKALTEAHSRQVLRVESSRAHLKIVGGAHSDDLLISTPEIARAVVRFLRTDDPGVERIVLPSL